MGLYPNMKNMTLVRIELKKIVDRFDVIVITEKLFESLVLIAQRNRFYFILNFFEAKLILENHAKVFIYLLNIFMV